MRNNVKNVTVEIKEGAKTWGNMMEHGIKELEGMDRNTKNSEDKEAIIDMANDRLRVKLHDHDIVDIYYLGKHNVMVSLTFFFFKFACYKPERDQGHN